MATPLRRDRPQRPLTVQDMGRARWRTSIPRHGNGRLPEFLHDFRTEHRTGHSSVILASENMVNYSLKFIGPILRGEVKTVEVKESAERAWTQQIQKELKNSVFMSGGCVNWYVDQKTNWNATVYPRTQVDFTLRCMFPVWRHWDFKYTRKGLFVLGITRVSKAVGVVALLWGLVYARRYGLQRTKELFRQLVMEGVEGVRDVLARGR